MRFSSTEAVRGQTNAICCWPGFLVFADEPKPAARQSLSELANLGIEFKIATADNPRVAEKVCADLGLASKATRRVRRP